MLTVREDRLDMLKSPPGYFSRNLKRLIDENKMVEVATYIALFLCANDNGEVILESGTDELAQFIREHNDLLCDVLDDFCKKLE